MVNILDMDADLGSCAEFMIWVKITFLDDTSGIYPCINVSKMSSNSNSNEGCGMGMSLMSLWKVAFARSGTVVGNASRYPEISALMVG